MRMREQWSTFLSASSILFMAVLVVTGLLPASASAQATCGRTITADVVAIDQPYYLNRLGAFNADGQMYGLRSDTVTKTINPATGTFDLCVLADGTPNAACQQLLPAPVPDLTGAQATRSRNIQLRPDKRPRPIALRMNAGDCIDITYENLVAPQVPIILVPAVLTASAMPNNRDLAEAITGMAWAPGMISYAIDAETRYELMRTHAMFLFNKAPHLIGQKLEIASSKWHLNCDYCLIGTWCEAGSQLSTLRPTAAIFLDRRLIVTNSLGNRTCLGGYFCPAEYHGKPGENRGDLGARGAAREGGCLFAVPGLLGRFDPISSQSLN